MPHTRLRFLPVIGLCALVVLVRPLAARQATPAKTPGDLDRLMARVLEHRDEGWKKLHDYVLSETEHFDLTGPGGTRLEGMRREYTWYVRDGYLIRSPLKFNGVTISEPERRKYEEKWLNDEKRRAEGRRRREEARRVASGEPSLQDLVGQGGEPRFITEAFFLKFQFEAGNYYLVGRERLEEREVLRIEYYPKNLFGPQRGSVHVRVERGKRSPEDAETDRQIEHDLNKVALVTLWVDPVESQVVRYQFDNIDFGFLPARWLLRVDTISATMTMARVLDGVWLPHDMNADAHITLATGTYGIQYGRELYDYKKAETGARIRDYKDRQP